MSEFVDFISEKYYLKDDKFIRKSDDETTLNDIEEVLCDIASYVENYIIQTLRFESIQIPPDADPYLSTTILASNNWKNASKLLIIIQNSIGSQIGLFSRSICLEQGLRKGSMISYLQSAIESNYGVIILRPNTNSILTHVDGVGLTKTLIPGSESPEIHTLCVYENIIKKVEANHIVLLGYANGAHLCKEIILRAMVKNDESNMSNRIKGCITIEASSITETDDALDIYHKLNKMVVNLECNQAPRGYKLLYRHEKLGCLSVSLGLPKGESDIINIGVSIELALSPVLLYLNISELGGDVTNLFVESFAKEYGLDPLIAVVIRSPNIEVDNLNDGSKTDRITSIMPKSKSIEPESSNQQSPGFFGRLTSYFGIRSLYKENKAYQDELKLTVNDFDLIKLVGKGAFGKVLLVRKNSGFCKGKIYAMKILKKSMIIAMNQVENTISEREILFEIQHPFIVRLRFAFQTDDKLYLITDYYNGGTLFYHLKKSTCFTEARARFYAAELLLALDHLHSQNIIYRDLKLENILLDQAGHVALTDFGLSKQNVDKTGGATTFCGTVSNDYFSIYVLKVFIVFCSY